MNALGVSTPAIVREIELLASPERVWRALTDPAELSRWLAERVALDPRPGGDGWFEWADHGRFAVRLEAVEDRRRLAFRWARHPNVAVADGPSTLVEIELRESPRGGTTLTLRETGFEDAPARADNVGGWFGAFEGLARHLAAEPWEAGIRRTYTFRSPPERVWRAFADPIEFKAWFGGEDPIEHREGASGWFTWPNEGRFAVRLEIVEPERSIVWSWATMPDVALGDAPEVLRTEWLLNRRSDGGTDVLLLETGFRGPAVYRRNDAGWDGNVIPALRRVLGEAG
jgi:uncharacterized protein YndB with AHSA1/START domain